MAGGCGIVGVCHMAGVSQHSRGPRAPERNGERPLAPLRAVRLPSPEATCGLEPGDSCLAKLGPVSRMVNTCLWMAVWTTWGAGGVSLWTALRHSCEVPDRQVRRASPVAGLTLSTACGQRLLGHPAMKSHPDSWLRAAPGAICTDVSLASLATVTQSFSMIEAVGLSVHEALDRSL